MEELEEMVWAAELGILKGREVCVVELAEGVWAWFLSSGSTKREKEVLGVWMCNWGMECRSFGSWKGDCRSGGNWEFWERKKALALTCSLNCTL